MKSKTWLIAAAAIAFTALGAGLIPFLMPSPQRPIAETTNVPTSNKLAAVEPAVSSPATQIIAPVQHAPVVQQPAAAPPPIPIVATPLKAAETQVAVATPLPVLAPPIEPTAKPRAAAPTAPPPKVVAPTPPFDPKRLRALPSRITNSEHQELALIRPGKFIMGDASLPDAPPHEVTLTQPIYLGVCEVTHAEYVQVMGAPEGAPAPPKDLPAPFVTWDQAMEFCQKLSDKPAEKAARRVYRLPTEAEWEYACRAGTTTKFSSGKTLDKDHANFGKKIDPSALKPPEGPGDERPQPRSPPPPRGNGRGQGPGPGQGFGPRADDRAKHPLEPVGIYPANAWGFKDMHGSVWEWCSDFYSPTAYKDGPAIDPTGPATGDNHVARGGCWSSSADECASAYRNGNAEPGCEDPKYGFRIVCEIAP